MSGRSASYFLFLSKLRYFKRMCFTVRDVPQLMQNGGRGSSLFVKYWCAMWVCPILKLVMAISCFLVVFSGRGQRKVIFLISCSLDDSLTHLFSHWSCTSLTMILLTFWYEKSRTEECYWTNMPCWHFRCLLYCNVLVSMYIVNVYWWGWL